MCFIAAAHNMVKLYNTYNIFGILRLVEVRRAELVLCMMLHHIFVLLYNMLHNTC